MAGPHEGQMEGLCSDIAAPAEHYLMSTLNLQLVIDVPSGVFIAPTHERHRFARFMMSTALHRRSCISLVLLKFFVTSFSQAAHCIGIN